MFRTALIVMLLMAGPAVWAQDANLTKKLAAGSGAVHQLIVAQRGYEIALTSGDVVLLLASVRLARGVVLRTPTAWQRTTEGEAVADAPIGKDAAPDPASPTAVAIVQTFAGEDPDLQDLAYDLDAQLPQSRKATAIAVDADLAGGQSDTWRMPLSGSVPAEIGLIGDGDSALSLSITDEAGQMICALPASAEPTICSFTPALNGFFTVTVRNVGLVQNRYRLLSN